MSTPNQYPSKTFVPYEGDMPVETIETPEPKPEREGIATVEADRPYALLSDEGRQEVYISRIALRQTIDGTSEASEGGINNG